jgi:hypothetical protein
MTGIFISYRRGDTTAYAGWLADSLGDHFGQKNVFRDIGSIEPCEPFGEAIERAIKVSAVMLVVIGRTWATKLKEQEQTGQEDYVRLEVSTALKRNVRVIPVLVAGASMPRADELPDELSALTRRNATELHDANWESDVQHLITVLKNAVRRGEEETKSSEGLEHLAQKDVAHGTIRITRQASQRWEWQRTISLSVDKEEIGDLVPEQPIELKLEPGPHLVEVRCPPAYEDPLIREADRISQTGLVFTEMLKRAPLLDMVSQLVQQAPPTRILADSASIVVHIHNNGELIEVLCGFAVEPGYVYPAGSVKAALFIGQL